MSVIKNVHKKIDGESEKCYSELNNNVKAYGNTIYSLLCTLALLTLAEILFVFLYRPGVTLLDVVRQLLPNDRKFYIVVARLGFISPELARALYPQPKLNL